MHLANKLKEIKDHADKVSDHSKILIANTENLYMPQIQLVFLFPSILMWFTPESYKQPRNVSNSDPINFLTWCRKHLESGWANCKSET